MEWVVERAGRGQRRAVQRTAFRNDVGDAPVDVVDHRRRASTELTEFIRRRTACWCMTIASSKPTGRDRLNWNRNARNMTALFWKPGSAPPSAPII